MFSNRINYKIELELQEYARKKTMNWKELE